MSSAIRVSDLVRRSSLGTGWYVIRDDRDCPIPDAPGVIYRAIISAGGCSVYHGGLYESNSQATAIPGGCLYEMVSPYGFVCLPPRTWIFGARALRQVFRLLHIAQPHRHLSGETGIPTLATLKQEWAEFMAQERLERISASLGALAWVDLPWLPWGRIKQPDHFDPIPLPILSSKQNPPPGVEVLPVDPRFNDDMYWTAEITRVRDSTGCYGLRADGSMEPY